MFDTVTLADLWLSSFWFFCEADSFYDCNKPGHVCLGGDCSSIYVIYLILDSKNNIKIFSS